ncbi:hypothetical protein I350_03300 [Cryptococcus amylolentus CBS 6273]|uniref:ABC transporter domain-containing protein n=1 Tax=Cryptococcus amylolentus CBS 6273 TaxID=1296118 RepID=A0A1E3K4B1_9TREE|nr:hypothetical protein I350_03300 [Cryptococcus amylolentus CBS 6273]
MGDDPSDGQLLGTRTPPPRNDDLVSQGSPGTTNTEKPLINNTAADARTNEEWTLAEQLLAMQADHSLIESRGLLPYKSLSLAYHHLSVRGVGGLDNIEYGTTMSTILAPWLCRTYRRKASQLATVRSDLPNAETSEEDAMSWRPGLVKPAGKRDPGLRKGERYLLKDFSGLVKAGEMMLVVGRPGSGCSTFLKALAGHRDVFAGVDGSVKYGDIEAGPDFKPYAREVIFSSEDDLHDPNLHVGKTLDFALRMTTPSRRSRIPNKDGGESMSRAAFQEKRKWELLRMFGLSHTHDTKVGDQYVRGVSGGERRRISITEVLTTKASIQLWDNATRGLDADTALRFARNLRTLTDIDRNTTVVSLYQAGNGIYDLFDKVTVIAGGRVIYYGPGEEARAYFENLGFVHPDGGNTADFLTAVTATNERQVRPDFQGRVLTTPAEFATAYNQSDIAHRMRQELEAHLVDPTVANDTQNAKVMIQLVKSRWASKNRPEEVDFLDQVRAAMTRNRQQRWGDKWTFWMSPATLLLQSLLAGSMFYEMPVSTGGLFLRGGTLFLSLFFPSSISFSETTAVFSGRAVLSKHKGFSMYRPSALLIAQTLNDLPVYFVMLLMFTLIIYFMTGLKVGAGYYFTYLLFVYCTTLCTTALFRFIGYSFSTFNGASKLSGFVFLLLSTYAGYLIYIPQMHPWFSWLRWIDPFHYSLEALMANEIDGLILECTAPNLAPYGGDYVSHSQGCAITGAKPNDIVLSGTAWLDSALRFYKRHVWRNFGILVGFWVFFLVLCAYAIENVPAAGSTKSVLLYKPGGRGKYIRQAQRKGEASKHEEDGPGENIKLNDLNGVGSESLAPADVHAAHSVLTWKNLSYAVNVDGEPRKLLDNVFGYCKAGTLTALMGSSGAGKTTLMDVLAARKTEGEIQGEVLINGKQLPVSFQRATGYCEQMDVHLPQATVREALEFSALLRQPRHLSNKEKLAYVDTIVDLLELQDIEDALIGTPGAGLGIEQRKRLTIGVELVSKPTLLFLDEPTSGLDGQSSYLIVSFLRKLAVAGQAVLCTIHQPSASLFARFDQLLLLRGGGQTVYFGAVDQLSDYFEKHGISIPANVNPAERMIEIVSGDISKGHDWHKTWLDSEECRARAEELDDLIDTGSKLASAVEGDEFEYASTKGAQLRLVTKRASVQLWRNTEYVMNKVTLHISAALINGFSFWKLGDDYADIKNRIFTIFLFVFVAPGVIAQTQPKFLRNRDIFEAREKKAKIYSWQAFCFAEIAAEIPYLLVCALLYFACWYPVVGFSFSPAIAGPVYLQMTFYGFLYTGIGQSIAAYAPHETFAALVNPLAIGVMVMFCGVLVPYDQITAFWRYWMYYLDPFQYLMGGLVSLTLWDLKVHCSPDEYAVFDPPSGMTCTQYMADFLSHAPGYLSNPESTSKCEYCLISKGSDFLEGLHLSRKLDAWRDIGITL